jgi:hypothetical protein
MRDSERDFTSGDVRALMVRLPDGGVLRFFEPFHIGRDLESDVQIQDVHVSRRHAIVSVAGGEWSIRDLQSSNGLWVAGKPVEAAAIGEGLTVSFGLDGPSLQFYPETPAVATTADSDEHSSDDSVLLDGYARRYFEPESGEVVGGRTLMIRRAFQKIQQKQTRKHRSVITAVVLAGLCAVGYAVYANRQFRELEKRAQDVFYSMKTIDVMIAGVEQELAKSGSERGQQQVRAYMEQRRQFERSYDEYATELYDRGLNEKERLILRVTRLFGECELAAPADYIREVNRYIAKWKSTKRLADAVKLAQDLGYTKRIVAEFKALDLPPQYFYLALQESDFDVFAVGKPTRWGIAKGMWQFIPETGQRYGLTIGPLSRSPRPDPADDRFKWDKATGAAARYVKDIYATDAQASGLLVMASYNWGERRIIDLLRTMPANPRERNFWQVLEKHRERVPPETYNYVFSIVSAAIIGENPKLFGFAFDNPLASFDNRVTVVPGSSSGGLSAAAVTRVSEASVDRQPRAGRVP